MKDFLELADSIGRVHDSMTNGSRIGEDFVVISTLPSGREMVAYTGAELYTHLVSFVAKEMGFRETLILDVIECVCLVPAVREDVEGDLPPD